MILSDDSTVHISTVSWWGIVIKSSIGKLDANVAELRKAALIAASSNCQFWESIRNGWEP